MLLPQRALNPQLRCLPACTGDACSCISCTSPLELQPLAPLGWFGLQEQPRALGLFGLERRRLRGDGHSSVVLGNAGTD